MANNGKNTNRMLALGFAWFPHDIATSRSQFFVSLKSCEHLNNKHSVSGSEYYGLLQ